MTKISETAHITKDGILKKNPALNTDMFYGTMGGEEFDYEIQVFDKDYSYNAQLLEDLEYLQIGQTTMEKLINGAKAGAYVLVNDNDDEIDGAESIRIVGVGPNEKKLYSKMERMWTDLMQSGNYS